MPVTVLSRYHYNRVVFNCIYSLSHSYFFSTHRIGSSSHKLIRYLPVQFMAFMKLEQYIDNFLTNGYDDTSSLKTLNEADLDVMGIKMPGHRKRILQNGEQFAFQFKFNCTFVQFGFRYIIILNSKLRLFRSNSI